MTKKAIKKIFSEDLPIYKEGTYKNCIDWKSTIGYKVKFIYDDIEGEVEIVNYNTKGNKLTLKYLEINNYKMDTTQFLACMLGKMLGKYTNEFKIEIGQIFKDNKRDLIITDREYRKDKNQYSWKWYKYTCNLCGWTEGWIIEGSLLVGHGCSVCCSNGKTVIEGINDIPTTNPWMIPYFQGGYDEAKLYTKCSSKKIYPICPDCGRIRDKSIVISSIYKNHSIACSCSDGQSYPFKFMFSLLEQLNIPFETEYNSEWIKPMRYDFYFESNDKKYIIETDGGFHNKDNKMSGQTKEKSKEIDDYKDRLAREHDIELIRIDCDKSELEYIENNILNSELNKLFDLSNINWLKCHEYTLKNLIKTSCNLFNSGIGSTTKIGVQLKLSRYTIRKYLKQGAILNWCNYNAKEEIFKGGRSKKIEMFKNNISLAIFKSGSELSKKSEKLFGTKLFTGGISSVCNGKQKQYKGFTFKYI